MAPEEVASAVNLKEGAPPDTTPHKRKDVQERSRGQKRGGGDGGGEGGEGGPSSPSSKKQRTSGGHSKEVENEQADLGSRYPKDTEVVVYAKPTEEDETIPLHHDDYFTAAGNFHSKVPLLAGIVLGSELDSAQKHGYDEDLEEELKLPPEFLALEVRKSPVPTNAYISL